MGYIYKVTNTVNDKCYIGYTEDPAGRWQAHKKGAGSKRLHDAMKCYGKDKFTFEVIAEDSVDNENNYIVEHNAMHPNGYNLTEGGGLPPNKKGMSYEEIYGDDAEAQRKKRQIKQLEAGGYGPKKHTPETKQKISNAVAGENNPMYGKKQTLETKQKISKAKKGKQIGATNPNAKVYCLTSPEGVKYRIHGNLRIKCKELGLSYATVSASLIYNRPIMRNGWKIIKGFTL